MWRQNAALLNYVAQDRPDLNFTSKEISKVMSDPTVGAGLKRIWRYLRLNPRYEHLYSWQARTNATHSDFDWGGDTKSRKSTTGGCLLRGTHLLAHWCKTQQTTALSLAESELNAMFQATQEGLAAKQPHEMNLFIDSSAARGVAMRRGSEQVEHLSIRQLWIQSLTAIGDVKTTPQMTRFRDVQQAIIMATV